MSISTVTETEPAWGRAHRLWRPDLPLVWLTIGLARFGALVLQANVAAALRPPAVRDEPGGGGLGPVRRAVRADRDLPRPARTRASGVPRICVRLGSVVAAPIALVANRSAQAIMTNLWGTELTARWAAAVVAPVNEEVLKALGVVVVVLVARRQVTTVLDGIVYGAFVGLGFQVAENFVYTTDALTGGLFGAEPGQVVLDMFVLRGLELGMWSHVVYTALAGFGIAYAVVEIGRGRVQRVVVCAAALLCAWGVHALWNAPFTQVPADAGPWEAWGVYVVKGLPALVLVLVLVAFARGREVRMVRGRTERGGRRRGHPGRAGNAAHPPDAAGCRGAGPEPGRDRRRAGRATTSGPPGGAGGPQGGRRPRGGPGGGPQPGGGGQAGARPPRHSLSPSRRAVFDVHRRAVLDVAGHGGERLRHLDLAGPVERPGRRS